MNYNHQYDILILIGALVIGFALFCIFYVHLYVPFKEEKEYIKMEMKRSHSKESYRYWKRRLRKLYFSRMPVIGLFVRRKEK